MATAVAGCSLPAVSTGPLTTPEYRNWLALGHALTTVLCEGLRPFVNRETEAFYRNVTAAVAAIPGARPCTCVYVARRKPNQYHDMTTCAWANILEAHHHSHKPNWKQSDPTKWMDPNLGPWEIAKLFLPDLGGHAMITSAHDMDVTAILNLMYWCDQFTIPQPLIKDVRTIRNEKWVHVPKLELSNADKAIGFASIEKLLQDPQLASDPDAQNALKEIVNLKSITDLHSMEAQVLADFQEIMNNLAHETERNKEEVSQLREDVNVLQQRDNAFINIVNAMIELFAVLTGNVKRSFKGIGKNVALMWMACFLFLGWCGVSNDDTFIKDGCALRIQPDLWNLKYFDFSEFITSSRKGFIGRQWLYQEMNQIMNEQDGGGILLIGNPGSGKTALVCHLLCSRTSSPFIHERILGYHFCMHSDKGTQNAAKFVRNLANMIAMRIEEYLEAISSDSFVSKVLQDNCGGEPEWCLQEAIITPLKKLHHQPKKPWYVIIDALDECAADKAEILNMLKSKVRRFPDWLKMIITTRNMSTITKNFEGLQRLELKQDDERNINDIDRYATDRIYPLQGSIISKIKSYFSIKDNNALSQRIVSSLVKKSQGNFLYVRVVLDGLSATTDSTRWTENIPKTLDNVFQLYFERKYTTRNSFQSLREIFEVLVASYKPLSAHQIHSVLQLGNPTLDYEYDIMPKLEEVSLFLWHGSRNGLVRIYHASLAEWLTGDSNKGKLYYVKKENGHKRLAKYYLQNAKKVKKQLTPEEAFFLTRHVVEGGSNEQQVQEFLSIDSRFLNSTDDFNSTALHKSACFAHPDVTELLVEHFVDVDCLNSEHRTPAFISASAGCLKNLILFASKGAKLNHTVKCTDFKPSKSSKNLVRECWRMTCAYSLLHIAAQEGNVDIVRFLIKRQANVLKITGCNNTAIQLAAENGHLEAVKVLKKAGGVLDRVLLYYASVGGHKSVVDYLLNEGVKDICIDGSHLRQDKTRDENRNNMLDTDHLITRETALHAAVRKKHLFVIRALLRKQENALNCANAAGRLPVHEAVHFNNYNALQVILAAGGNTTVPCNAGAFAGHQKIYCPCGFTALHVAAMHGHNSVAKLLIEHNADVNVRDCDGSTPLHIASCHGKVSIIKLLVHSGAKINGRTFNLSTPLHSSAACLATSSFSTLLELGSNYSAQDNKNMTVLHYLVNNIKFVGREYFADLYVDRPINWIEALNEKQPWEKGDLQFTWLNALVRMTHSLNANIDGRLLFNLPQDHAIRKAYDDVFHLLDQKSNAWNLITGGKIGCTLPTILSPELSLSDILHSNYVKGLFVSFLPKTLTKMMLKTMSIYRPEILDCAFLINLVKINAVRLVNLVLNRGMDVNCQDQSGLSPLFTYLHRGGRHMSKVLAKHEVTLDISCGAPFKKSSMHLISYHKLHYLHYLSEFSRGPKEWSKYLASNDSLFDYFLDNYEEVRDHRGLSKVIRSGDGPLTLAIKSYPRGIKVINDCFDAEGYNALHRAAQGANVIALRRFLAWGANPFLKNADGFSPLWLSVLYSHKYTLFINASRENILTGLEMELASISASVILNHLIQFGTVNIGCDASRPDLSLYHLAAIRGMWPFVYQLLSKKQLLGVDVNCPNRDGITPMYLAKLVGGDTCNWHSPWCKVVKVIEEFGGTFRYPKLEAEYFLSLYMFGGINLANVCSKHDFTKCSRHCENTRFVDISDFAFSRIRKFTSGQCKDSPTLCLKKLISGISCYGMNFEDLEYLTILKYRGVPF